MLNTACILAFGVGTAKVLFFFLVAISFFHFLFLGDSCKYRTQLRPLGRFGSTEYLGIDTRLIALDETNCRD